MKQFFKKTILIVLFFSAVFFFHPSTPNKTYLPFLKELAKEDKKATLILQHYDDYPEKLLEMLSRNREIIDYVLEFPQKKGKVSQENVNCIDGEIPLLIQWSEEWGYGTYGDGYIGMNGCAPTALSMVIIGLTGKKEVTPYAVAKYAEENHYYQDGVGTSWSLMTEGCKHFGIIGEEVSLRWENVYHTLKNGNPIIASVRKGDFTQSGHFIVLVGIQEEKIIIYDPNSIERSEQLWEYERIAPQIKNMWAFRLL